MQYRISEKKFHVPTHRGVEEHTRYDVEERENSTVRWRLVAFFYKRRKAEKYINSRIKRDSFP